MDPFRDVMYRAFHNELEKIAMGTAGKVLGGAVLGAGALEGGRRVMKIKRLADAESEDIRIQQLAANTQRAQMELEMRRKMKESAYSNPYGVM